MAEGFKYGFGETIGGFTALAVVCVIGACCVNLANEVKKSAVLNKKPEGNNIAD